PDRIRGANGLSRLLRVHEFAELAGVTVKALHHYDRLGLLKPTRTDAGYRKYADADLERLEHILALKFWGFSLKQVRAILERTSLEWAEALRWQREAIEDTQAHLGRASGDPRGRARGRLRSTG